MFRRVSIRVALFLGDLVIVALALLISSLLRPQLSFGRPLPIEDVWLAWPIYTITLMVWSSVFLLMDVYNLQKNLRIFDELQRVVMAHLAASLAIAGILYFSYRDTSRLQVITFALTALLMMIGYRLMLRLFLRFFGDKRYGTRRVVVVGAGKIGRNVAEMVIKNSWTGLRLIGFIDDNSQADTLGYPHLGTIQQTVEAVQTYDINEVIFALPRHAHVKLANVVVGLQHLKVNVRVVPDFFDLVFLRSAVEDLGDIHMVTLREPALDPLQRAIKRGFDLLVGSFGFMFSLPFMILIAITIKLDSSGPVIFSQLRVGENGRLFRILKFRSMVHDPDIITDEISYKIIDGQPLHKFYNDPRVTKFGRFLRKTSLDELPQFINILKGDMSLVGPRPELPWLVDKYEPWQRKRFEVPQGLTGWWQVNGRADKPMHLNTADDLYYIKNYSIWLDIQILWRTVRAVIERRGSY
ncbi:MAG: sugar transferase [Anaerolineae bacterium]|nr:sugar transferase [Anaerolineae bacterium]